MKYTNELKVGLTIVVACILLFIGIRYLQNLPAFGNTYEIYTEFQDAEGVLSSTNVYIRGVQVGKVSKINFNEDKSKVRIFILLSNEIKIPTDSNIQIEGISALGGISLAITPGQNTTFLNDGELLQAIDKPDLIGDITNEASEIAGNLDNILSTADSTLGDVQYLINNPNSDLRAVLVNISQTMQVLNRTLNATTRLVQSQQTSLTKSMQNIEGLTRNLNEFSANSTDSLAMVVQNLNTILKDSQTTFATLDSSMQNLNTITGGIAKGDGTVGKLLNDNEQLYKQIDSTLTNLNSLLKDLEDNPRKYLRGVVKIF